MNPFQGLAVQREGHGKASVTPLSVCCAWVCVCECGVVLDEPALRHFLLKYAGFHPWSGN